MINCLYRGGNISRWWCQFFPNFSTNSKETVKAFGQCFQKIDKMPSNVNT